MNRVTGTIITVERKTGPVLYLKGRDRQGRQHKRRLGPVADWGRKQADDALRDWLTDLGRTPTAGDSGVTLEHAATAWLRYVEHDQARAPSTVRDYRNTMRRDVLPFLGADRPLATLTTADIDELRAALLARLSRRSAQKILVLVHGMLKLAKRRGWIASNPAEDAERVRVRRRAEFAVLSPAEVHAAARVAYPTQVGAAILVAAFTGLRMGELRALRWRDVDFANRIIHVRRALSLNQEGPPKSGTARSVPLIDHAARPLDALSRRARFIGPPDLVFPSITGGPVDEGELRRGLYAALETAGIDRDRGTGKALVWHDLRHSFGTLAVQAFALSDVQAYMGHAHVTTTMVYVHHTPQHNAADRLSQLVDAAVQPGPFTLQRVPAGTELSQSQRISGHSTDLNAA